MGGVPTYGGDERTLGLHVDHEAGRQMLRLFYIR